MSVPDGTRERVVDCHDPDVLKRWFRRAITATPAGRLFADD